MAGRKKEASALDVGKIIVAFVLKDHAEGEGEDAVTFSKGQRLELDAAEFDALSKAGICEEGIFAKMKTGVEGARYSLKPHDKTWLPPTVYEAWKAAGYCEPADDDPEVGAVLQAREEAMRDAVKERDAARVSLAASQMQCDALLLELAAAKAQLDVLVDAASGILDGTDEAMEPIKTELQKLVDMFPDQIGGVDDEPQLKLG